MGSAIWATKSNPNCRLPVTSRMYVGLPLGVVTFGRYFLWQGPLPLTENQHHQRPSGSVPRYWPVLIGEIHSVCLWALRPVSQTEFAFFSFGRTPMLTTRV
jgi:hypothetical protein